MHSLNTGVSTRGRCVNNHSSNALLGALEISFHTNTLLDTCVDEVLADRALGSDVADALRKRLNDIRAADCVFDLIVGQPTSGKVDGVDCYRIRLFNDAWLTFVPSHANPRVDNQGNTDWARVRRVKVVAVGEIE